ncbi:MAG: SLC13 family permease [Tindallia sp. MSAO_Bac2]|nr:MAG: SLC13 family permease [Tindallia sp. MSAO_Bac2]
MDASMMIVFGLLLFTMLMLVLDILRVDLIALLVMLTLGWTGILTTQETLSGFSSNAVIAMISVMMMSHGLSKTGLIDRLSQRMVKKIGTGKKKIVFSISLIAGVLSGIMITVGVAAIFLPVVLRISRKQKIPASDLMIPMGFGAILGANLTMVGSAPLIVLNDLLVSEGMESYGLMAVFPVGAVLLLSGLVYFWFGGEVLLPQKQGKAEQESYQEKLMKHLDLCGNIEFYQIPEHSSLCGKTVEESGMWVENHLHLLGINGKEGTTCAPWRDTRLQAGQFLAIQGQEESVQGFARQYNLKKVKAKNRFPYLSDPESSGFVEIVIPPRSQIAGKTLREFGLRKRYAVEPLMLFSRGERIEEDFSDYRIQQGDTMVVYGLWDHMEELNESEDFLVITPFAKKTQLPGKTWIAVACLVIAVALTLMGAPVSMAFLTGAVLMILLGVLKITEVYQVVDWKVIFLLAGLIPLGSAMQKTGAAEWLADQLIRTIQGGPPILLLFSVAFIASFFSLFMSNVGAVVVLVPLVTSMATMEGLDPRPVALLAAVCASNSFMLPTHQVNALILSPGGYRNADFIKAGGGMTFIYILVTVMIFHFFMV